MEIRLKRVRFSSPVIDPAGRGDASSYFTDPTYRLTLSDDGTVLIEHQGRSIHVNVPCSWEAVDAVVQPIPAPPKPMKKAVK